MQLRTLAVLPHFLSCINELAAAQPLELLEDIWANIEWYQPWKPNCGDWGAVEKKPACWAPHSQERLPGPVGSISVSSLDVSTRQLRRDANGGT